MNRLIVLLFVFLGSIVPLCGMAEEKNFTVAGEITGMEDGAKVVLIVSATPHLGRGWVAATVENGKFVLRHSTDSPRYCILAIMGKEGRVEHDIMVYDEDVTVKGKVVKDENGQLAWEDFSIEGSPLNRQLREKIAFRMENKEKWQAAEKRFLEEMMRIQRQAMKTGERLTGDNTEVARANREVEEARAVYRETMRRETVNAVCQNLDSFWGPFLMSLNRELAFPKENQQEGEELYEQFSEEAKASYYGQIMREWFFPGAKNVFPDFIAEDRNGEDVETAVLRKGEKCVILDFWAAYCVPCRKVIPELKSLYADYADKGLEIVSVSVDLKREDWLKALDEERMPWPNLLDTRNVFSEKFNGMALPLVIVVDGSGKIIARNVKGNALRVKIKEALEL